MRLLLDTHVFLWWNSEPNRLSREARELVEDPGNGVWLSAASVWEMAIKKATGRLKLSDSPAAAAISLGFELISISAEDAEVAAALPRHHEDPFDRMLIAQAIRRDLVLLTMDEKIRMYAVPLFPAR